MINSTQRGLFGYKGLPKIEHQAIPACVKHLDKQRNLIQQIRKNMVSSVAFKKTEKTIINTLQETKIFRIQTGISNIILNFLKAGKGYLSSQEGITVSLTKKKRLEGHRLEAPARMPRIACDVFIILHIFCWRLNRCK